MNAKPLQRAVAEACAALTRREFIGGAVATVGAAALPLGALTHAAAPPRATIDADWAIDDQWTGFPRPTEAVRVRSAAPTLRAVAPADRGFVA